MPTTQPGKGNGKGSLADRNQQLLAAGALLPARAPLLEESHSDLVDARVYRHPALGDRQVVRLTPAALAEGEAVVLEFLGFEVKKAVVREAVARRRRQALGFPAWALVHDPKKARFALEVMKDFRREARRAKSKPGGAKEGIDAIAKKLARSVPHFLPSFYEEAGRVFIDTGNGSYAAQCFGKAREAEQVHGLEIDEEARKAAFLEFALCGAVTIKALSSYARDLEQAHGPAEAYGHFREIAVRRTLGGLPPWAGMAKDMQRLARGAGLEVAAEDDRLVAELLPASSLNRAPVGFWDAYKEALARQVARSPGARDQLLQLSPRPGGGSEEHDHIDQWLKLLEEVGALRGWLDAAPGAAVEEPRGKAAAWLGRMLKLGAEDRWPPAAPDSLFALVRRLAVHLSADGTPVRPYLTREWDDDKDIELEVDFCDLCLELKLPVADPSGKLAVDLDNWAQAAEGSKERPRDPVRVARDPRFAEAFQEAVSEACGDSDFETAAKGKQALAEARRRWLLELCEPTPGALPALGDRLERIGGSTTVHTFAEFLEALPRLQVLGEGIEGRLARSLRGGVAAELCWPALEAACEALDPDGEATLKFGGSFPNLVVTDEKKAIVVGPKGKLLEHDLRLGKGGNLRWLQFVDGQLLVVFRDKGHDDKAYWSGSPKQVFEPDLEGWLSIEPEGWQLPLAGGGVHLGGGPLRPGDTKIPEVEMRLLCDGKTFWRLVERGDRKVLEEFEPLGGEKGRKSLPAFLEDFVREGSPLVLDECRLMPAPEGLGSSPLGMKDGLLGWRVRRPPSEDEHEVGPFEQNEVEGIDGRRYRGSLGGDRFPDALLSLPGDVDQPRPLDVQGYLNEDLDEYQVMVWDGDGEHLVARWSKGSPYAAGVPVVLPIYWWHLLQARDEKGSAALRSVTEAACRELLEAAEKDLAAEAERGEEDNGDKKKEKKKKEKKEKKQERSEPRKTEAAVKKLLPAIGDKVLRQGVAGVVLEAARLRAQQQELSRRRDPQNPEATLVAEEGGEEWADLDDLLRLIIDDSGSLDGVVGQLRGVSSCFATGKGLKVPEASCHWPELVGRLGSLLYLAAAPGTSPANREAALRFLAAWQDTIFVQPEAGRLRRVTCKLHRKKLPFPVQDDGSWRAWAVGVHGGNQYFLSGMELDEDEQDSVPVLEHAPDGKLKLLPGATISGEDERLDAGWATPEKLERFLEVVQARGPWSYERAMGEALASRTGISYAEAALLLAGCPGFHQWESKFLSTDLREGLGVKLKEAEAARDALRRIGEKKLRDILDGALPDDPEALYRPLGAGPEDDASFVARLAESYAGVMGKRIPLDAALVAQLGRELRFLRVEPLEMIDLLSNPKKAPALNQDASWHLGEYGVEEEGEGFGSEMLECAAVYLLYLASELPVGHPLLKALPEVHARVAKRLASPRLLLDAAMVSLGNKKKAMALVESFGGKSYQPKTSGRKADVMGRDNGALVALVDPDEGDSVWVAFRPGKVKDWSTLRKLCAGDDEGGMTVFAAEAMLSSGAKEIVARLAKSPVPEGSYEANPLLSAPAAVKEVAKKLELSEDAAVYYLQLLALAAPTQARVQLWNGWTPARLKKAGEELKKARLVVEARRARAGRSHFLPGGWEALAAPNLPVESWKLPLYGVTWARKGEKLRVPFQRLLPTRPLHVLFDEAWKRVQKGDKPEYEKVK